MICITLTRAPEGRRHFTVTKKMGLRHAKDIGEIILTWEDRKPYGRNIFLCLTSYLSRHSLPGASRLLPLFPSLWANLTHVSMMSTFWWTPNLPLAQIFLLSTRPLFLISYWAFPRSAIPQTPYSTSLELIHYLAQQACFVSCLYSTINCITVHSALHWANVPQTLQCARWGYR